MNKLKSTYVSFLLVLFEKLQCLFIFWLKIYIMCHKTDHVKSLLEPCIITGQLLSSYFLHCASFRFVSSSAGLRLLLKEVCLVERRVHVSYVVVVHFLFVIIFVMCTITQRKS